MDLRKVWAIAVREFGSFFVSPIVYGFLSAFLFLLGYFTVGMIVTAQKAELSLSLILFVFLIFAPLLTMRLISSERSTGTIEFIFTSPIRSSEFVLGKYFAVLGVFGVSVIFTLEFPVFLIWIGDPDLQVLMTQYLGLVLVGATFLAVGVFCSAVTENQIVAAVASFVVLLLLWVIAVLKGMVPSQLEPIVSAFDLAQRIQHFQNGLLKLTDVVFFLSIIITFLYASILYLNSRSWRK
ncbi:MAG: ABC transporter permease subunit [bacterium]